MLLIDYLSKNFFTKALLLEVAGISEARFAEYQNKLVMPQASYKLKADIVCHTGLEFMDDPCLFHYFVGGMPRFDAMIDSN